MYQLNEQNLLRFLQIAHRVGQRLIELNPELRNIAGLSEADVREYNDSLLVIETEVQRNAE